jgi:hypothetical protein
MNRAALFLSSLLATSVAWAQAAPAVALPTLDEGGLIAMIALVGVIGGIIARRRMK